MSGLIYGAIVLIWAAVLVPMWLKRHDDAVEAKSVDRFSTAMKVLARRTTAPDIGAVQTAATPSAVGTASTSGAPQTAPPQHATTTGAVADDGAARRPGMARLSTWGMALRRSTAGVTAPVARRVADRPAAAVRGWLHRPASRSETVALDPAPATRTRRHTSMAVRRQRILSTLAAVTVLAAVLAYLGLLSWYATAAVGLLLAGYLVLLRLNAKQASTTAASGTAVNHRHVASVVRGPRAESVAEEDASHTVKINPAPVRRQGAAAPEPQPASAAAAGTTIGATGRTAPGTAVPDGFVGPRVGWDPVPVPSPTYVSAPRAPRAVRSIDLSADGAWTSGRLVADARAAAAAAVVRSGHRSDEGEPARRAAGEQTG